MTERTEEQGTERAIDLFYGQPIGSRRLEIQKLHYKLHQKYFGLFDEIYKKYKGSFRKINEGCEEIATKDRWKWLCEQGYFELLHNSHIEYENLRKSPLGRIVSRETGEIFDRSDHENMLTASNNLFRIGSDPVLSTVLNDGVYKPNVLGNTKRERKKARHREDIYARRLQKHVYQRYLSEVVGKPITTEEYEREYGFLSDKGETI